MIFPDSFAANSKCDLDFTHSDSPAQLSGWKGSTKETA